MYSKARPSTPKHSEQLLGTYGNLLNLKKHEIFDLKKTSYRRRKKERRTKQSLDSPQTIEANKNPSTFSILLIFLFSIRTSYSKAKKFFTPGIFEQSVL